MWFNIHIPKCAGSTFIEILKKNFKQGFGDGRGYLSDVSFKYSEEHVREIVTHFPNLTCFSDHKLSIKLPFEENHMAIVFVRDPVDRFLSHYFYTRNDPYCNFDPKAKSLGIAEYIETELIKKERHDLANGQTYHLTGQRSNQNINKIFELVNQEKLLMFNVERFDEACVILEHKFPEVFGDCTYTLQNVSKKDQAVNEDLKAGIGEYMAMDNELWRFSNSTMDRYAKDLFSNKEVPQPLISSFRARCLSLNKISVKSTIKRRIIQFLAKN